MTITTTIPTYSGNDPDRVDGRATFVVDMAASLTYQKTLSTYLNSFATEANALSVTVNGYMTTTAAYMAAAGVSESNASDSATQAAISAGAGAYAAGTEYSATDTVIASDGHTYRFIGGSPATGDNPVGSATGNWLPLTTTRVLPQTKTSAFTAIRDVQYFVNTTSAAITVTLPLSPSSGDTVYIADYAGTFRTNALTVGRNGQKIMGLSEDMEIDTDNVSIKLMYVDSTVGWRII